MTQSERPKQFSEGSFSFVATGLRAPNKRLQGFNGFVSNDFIRVFGGLDRSFKRSLRNEEKIQLWRILATSAISDSNFFFKINNIYLEILFYHYIL